MENTSTGTQLLAIVVGRASDEFVRHTTVLLDNYEVETVLCENVYSAISKSAKNAHRNILVFGRLEQLGKEDGRFFEKANKDGTFCCCLAERYLDVKRKQISQAAGAGAIVINDWSEVEKVIAGFLADKPVSLPAKKESSKAANFNSDEFVTTKEELDALLEA